MSRIIESFQGFIGPLSTAQRTMFFGLTAAVIIFVGSLLYWALQPDYSLLFGSLQTDSAQEIIEELDERGIKYRLEDGGRSIFVPGNKVHELRIQLASVTLTQSHLKGYELFDTNALGMTDFMQQVNKKRALEGELARSINSFEQVEFSRVHLVLPERSPFQQSSVQASASVILNLKRSQTLKKEQVEGITALVAGSVEGLETASITILDQSGNRLTDGMDPSSDFASGNMQMQLRQKTESYLTDRGQSMLDRVLGSGNSILRVSAEHDFDRLVRESDLIDPDSRMIISEERRSEINNDEGLQQVPVDEFTPVARRGETVTVSRRDNELTTQTRNYEVNKTREIFEKTQGEVKRLTASLLLNYKQSVQTDENGNEVLISEPYSPEEINEFREVVRLALGIQPARGDELSITQIEFYNPMAADYYGISSDQPTPWNDIIRWALILASFLTIVALIYSIKKRLGSDEPEVMFGLPNYEYQSIPLTNTEQQSLENMSEQEMEDFIDKKITGQSRKRLEQKAYVLEEIKDFVEMKPAEAAQVVRAMMTLDEE